MLSRKLAQQVARAAVALPHASNSFRSGHRYGSLMPFERMKLEIWFDRWQYHCTKDIGESAVKWKSMKDLEGMGIDISNLEFRYGHHTGLPELKKEIIDKQYPGLTTDNILVTSGGSESIFCFYAALADKGDNILCEMPNYPSNYGIPEGMGLDVTRCRLEFDSNFKLDVEKLKSMVKPNTKVISLTHPNNPTGSIITEEQIRDLAAFCESRNMMLLLDETYRNMYEGEPPIPAAMINKHCASITSMSKCYGIPGCRVGWIVSQNTELLENMLTVREYISITNNTVGEVLSLEVLKRRDGMLAEHRAHIAKNKKFIAEWIANHEHLEWVVPEVGVVGFPRFKDETLKRLDLENFYVTLADKYKTFVVPGDRMDYEARYFRVGFGGDEHDVKEGTASFDACVKECVG